MRLIDADKLKEKINCTFFSEIAKVIDEEPTVKAKVIIDSFCDEYEFLSNFYICSVVIDDVQYSSSEAAYQAQKCKLSEDKSKFTFLDPREAKKLGRTVEMRPDWENIKFNIMNLIVFEKFKQNKYLAEKLIATDDAELIEGNYWRDTYWGVYDKTGEGLNNLGKILMLTRSILRGDPNIGDQI